MLYTAKFLIKLNTVVPLLKPKLCYIKQLSLKNHTRT